MRVPSEYLNAAEAEIVIRMQSGATGKLEASKKLSELPEGTAVEAAVP